MLFLWGRSKKKKKKDLEIKNKLVKQALKEQRCKGLHINNTLMNPHLQIGDTVIILIAPNICQPF